jgi:hypothetical protein
LHGGSEVEVVDEVDGDVETGADAEVEVDEEVVDVDVGTEVVGGTEVVEDDVELEVVVGTIVDDVDVDEVEVVELDVVDASVEEVVEVELVEVAVEEVGVLDVEVEVVDVDVEEVVEVDVVDVELDVVDVVEAEDVEVVELEVVDADVEEVVEVDVVVVGTVLPPSTSPTSISSATNVPRIVALKRVSVAGFPSAQSWATTTVVFVPNDRPPNGTRKLHVVVASGTGRPAVPWSEKTSASWVPPAMLTASCLPLTSTRRSCGEPPTLICELGRTLKELATSSVLDAAAITWLLSFVVTLQKTYAPPSSWRVPPLTVRSP